MDPAWIGAICAIATLLLTASVVVARRLAGLLKWFWGVAHRTEQFLEDFNGTPARPGVPARRGVLERLSYIEGELSYDSGQSVKDAVHRIDENVRVMAGPRVP